MRSRVGGVVAAPAAVAVVLVALVASIFHCCNGPIALRKRRRDEVALVGPGDLVVVVALVGVGTTRRCAVTATDAVVVVLVVFILVGPAILATVMGGGGAVVVVAAVVVKRAAPEACGKSPAVNDVDRRPAGGLATAKMEGMAKTANLVDCGWWTLCGFVSRWYSGVVDAV